MHRRSRNIVREAKGSQCDSLIVCATHHDNVGSNSWERFLFFDQLAAWTTYWPWSDLCRDFVRPRSIKLTLRRSSYVPSWCSEWLLLTDATVKCQVITTVVVCLDATFTVRVHLFWTREPACTCRYRRNGGFVWVYVYVCDRPFSELRWVWKIIIMLKGESCFESKTQRSGIHRESPGGSQVPAVGAV